MSPGKAAYEQRKQGKKELKMRREKSAEEYQRHNDLMDEVGELALQSVKAFLTGKAFLDILPGPNVEGSKVVYFRLETPVV